MDKFDNSSISTDPYHPRQDIYGERDENFERIRYQFALELLPPNKSKYQKILDVGGGAAEFSRIVEKRGYDVVFIDGNKSNVERAKSLGYDSYRIDLNNNWNLFNENEFDGAVLLDVIEHVVGVGVLLREIERILKDNGFLIITTPNYAYWKYRLDALRGNPPPGEGYHFRFFTKKYLSELLEKVGLKVEASASIVRLPFIHKLFWKRDPKEFFIHAPFLESIFAKDLAFIARKKTKQ